MIDGVVSSTPTIGHVNSNGVSLNAHGREDMLREFAPRNFVAGAENRLAAVAFAGVIAEPVPRDGPAGYNPLTLFGPAGSGKTLLVQELAASWRQRHKQLPVVSKPAVEFAQDFKAAVESQDVEQFRREHRKASLLIIEDLTHIANREAAQCELRATIDELLAEHRRLVVTANLAPGQWPNVAYDLQARLTAGLSVSLVYPQQESRVEIIARLATRSYSEWTEEAALLLASAITGPAAKLSGAVHQLTLAAAAAGRKSGGITVEDVKRYLARHNGIRQPDMREIAAETARLFSLKVVQLRGRSRSRAVTTARGVAMYIARKLTQNSLQQIGHYFGGRDHTTVLHGCRKTEALIESEPDLQRAVEQVQNKLRMVG